MMTTTTVALPYHFTAPIYQKFKELKELCELVLPLVFLCSYLGGGLFGGSKPAAAVPVPANKPSAPATAAAPQSTGGFTKKVALVRCSGLSFAVHRPVLMRACWRMTMTTDRAFLEPSQVQHIEIPNFTYF